MNNNITPSKYAKKAFVIFGIIVFALIIIPLLINIKYHALIGKGDPLSEIFALGIILIPSLCALTYIAFVGARKLINNSNVGKVSYYWIVIPITILSAILSTIVELLFIKTSAAQDFGAFLFFGGLVLIPFYFMLLNIIGIIELYIIKKKILRDLNNK